MTSTCAQRGRRSGAPTLAMRLVFVAGIVTATWLGGSAVASAMAPSEPPDDHRRESASRGLPLDPAGRIESRLSVARLPELPGTGRGQAPPKAASKVHTMIEESERAHSGESGASSGPEAEPGPVHGSAPHEPDRPDTAERVEQAIDEHRAAAQTSSWSSSAERPLDGQSAGHHSDSAARPENSTSGAPHPVGSGDGAVSPAEPPTVPLTPAPPAGTQQHGTVLRAVSEAPDQGFATSKDSALPGGHEQGAPTGMPGPHQVPLPFPPSSTLCTATPCPGVAGARGALVYPVRTLVPPDSVLVRLGAPMSIQPSGVVPEGPAASPD